MRTCPVCNRKFFEKPGPKPVNCRPVWTCKSCYQKERERTYGRSARRRQTGKMRIEGATVGHGPKETTPETREKLKALFRSDPERVIHRLCDLMEGTDALQKLREITGAARKMGREDLGSATG